MHIHTLSINTCKISTVKLLELMNEFSKIAGYQIKAQKLVVSNLISKAMVLGGEVLGR